MTKEQVSQLVGQKALELGEHFDAVQILATYYDSAEGTMRCYKGTGNFYARKGMAQDFIESERAEDQAEAIAQKMHREDM